MPRSTRVPPPGAFTTASKVVRANFQFAPEGRSQLSDLLAEASPELCKKRTPPQEISSALADAGKPIPETPAAWIIACTEEQIRLLLSAQSADPKAAPGNPANYRSAIRRLKRALEPFVKGWVDPETAAIADWKAIDKALGGRAAELALIKRPPPYERRQLQYNCLEIVKAARCHAWQAGVQLSDGTLLRFLHEALSLAAIRVPDPDEHGTRLREFVFGPKPQV